MRNQEAAHLNEGRLLLFLDGELDASSDVSVRQHLDACWSCRARCEALRETITTITRARNDVLLPGVPPPGPWEGLGPHLARVDREMDPPGPLRRWQGALVGSVRLHRFRLAAVAVAAAAVIFVVVSSRDAGSPRVEQPPSQVGVLANAIGIVRALARGGDGSPRVLKPGDALRAGDTVETGPVSRAAFTLTPGVSLRLDAETELTVASDQGVTLVSGAVYVDSRASAAMIEVHTAFGRIVDIGTQFEVRLGLTNVTVRVREGAIRFDNASSPETAHRGEAVRWTAGSGLERFTTDVAGPEWAWASAIAPPFQLDGQVLPRFLDWVSREQGWEWRFVDAATAERGRTLVPHGSLEGLTPEEALDVVLKASGLRAFRNDRQLVVSFIEPSR